MYGEGAGTAVEQRFHNDQPKEVPVGLHSQLSDLTKRIAQSVAITEKMLDRVLGPKPMDGLLGGPKTEREPTTHDLVNDCHRIMQRLEARLTALNVAIS